ncbi:unnamed protein product, partial [Ectocarpus sp. 13 AM-2016]
VVFSDRVVGLVLLTVYFQKKACGDRSLHWFRRSHCVTRLLTSRKKSRLRKTGLSHPPSKDTVCSTFILPKRCYRLFLANGDGIYTCDSVCDLTRFCIGTAWSRDARNTVLLRTEQPSLPELDRFQGWRWSPPAALSCSPKKRGWLAVGDKLLQQVKETNPTQHSTAVNSSPEFPQVSRHLEPTHAKAYS